MTSPHTPVMPISPEMRKPLEWDRTPQALALLAKVDAFERMSDAWSFDCPEAAKGFSEAADDLEGWLDNLRCDALHDAMKGCSAPYASDAYFEQQDEADEALPTVQDAIKRARTLKLGDTILRNF